MYKQELGKNLLGCNSSKKRFKNIMLMQKAHLILRGINKTTAVDL